MANASVYGYVNGKPVYSRDEFIFTARGFGPIETDEELLNFAVKCTYGWQSAGHKHSFADFYLGSLCVRSRPLNTNGSRPFRKKKGQGLRLKKTQKNGATTIPSTGQTTQKKRFGSTNSVRPKRS